MPSKLSLSHSIHLPAPQAKVFDAAMHWEGQRYWILFTSVRPRTKVADKKGDEIEAFTGFGPFGFLDTMTIATWEYPTLCVVIHTGKVVRGTGTFEVRSEGTGSRFTWKEDMPLPFGPFGALLWPLLWLPSKVGLILSLYRFKAHFHKILADKDKK